MKVRGIIFDLDGTLLNTLADLAEAANQTLEHFGYPAHAVDRYRYFVGDGLSTLIERILPENKKSKEKVQDCIKQFTLEYLERWNKNSAPYPGILEMLTALKNNNIKLAVLSNKPHDFTKLCVAEYFDSKLFAFVFGNREKTIKKPDPAGALEIASLMELSPDEILYIGDTSVDMATGKRSGMITFGVLWGFREIDELLKAGADKIISHPEEIVEYVLSAG